MADGLLDRLRLDAGRVAAIAADVRAVAALPDPCGEVVRGQRLPNGLRMQQVRVPMGVVAMIYEARPNVTVDAAALALKSGNAVVLRGGSAALESNVVLVEVIREALVAQGLPADLVSTVDPWGREGAAVLMRARGLVDVLIPRGGAGLIQAVVEGSTVPVIETGVGNCHVYLDASADPRGRAAHRAELQDPPGRGLQRRRDRAGARRRGRRAARRRARRPAPRRCRGCTSTTGPRRPPPAAASPSSRPPTTTGPPSTSPSRSRSASSTPSTTRSSTSGAGRAVTPRRS